MEKRQPPSLPSSKVAAKPASLLHAFVEKVPPSLIWGADEVPSLPSHRPQIPFKIALDRLLVKPVSLNFLQCTERIDEGFAEIFLED